MSAADLDQACARAMELQLAGDREASRQLYTEILQRAPRHAAANYCLGMLCVQEKRVADGLPYLKTALEAQPAVPDYWLGYLEGLVLAGQGLLARRLLALGQQRGIAGPGVEEFVRRLQASEPQASPAPSTPVRRFIVLAPPYNRQSAGIRVLHDLCRDLNQCGYTAHVISYRFRADIVECYTPSGDEAFGPQHAHIPRLPASNDMEQFRELINDAVVIYPEAVMGNPLRAPRVARYVLNSPAANGYPMWHGEKDFIVSFAARYWDKPHFTATLVGDEPLFNDAGTRPALKRTLDCTYIGKGAQYGECHKLKGTVFIDRQWPADKESLAIMLRHTRFFYTWDVVSQTNLDALFCGAIPVVLRLAPFTQDIFDSPFGRAPFGEGRLADGEWQVNVDMKEFVSGRSRFISAYRSTVRERPQIVAGLARAIDRYFSQ